MAIIVVSMGMAFQGRMHSDESAKYLEYNGLIEIDEKLYEENPYNYYSVTHIMVELTASLGLLAGAFALNRSVEKKHYAKAQANLNSESHKRWMNSINGCKA